VTLGKTNAVIGLPGPVTPVTVAVADGIFFSSFQIAESVIVVLPKVDLTKHPFI
jgi:hypothetical protein